MSIEANAASGAQLQIHLVPMLILSGESNTVYCLEYTDEISDPSVWNPLTNITVFDSTSSYVDTSVVGGKDRFYRVSLVSPYTNIVVQSPAIRTQPANASGIEGTSQSFVVEAVGTEPIDYQWYHNGLALSNATNPVLVLPNVSAPLAGQYLVLVRNTGGSTISQAVNLTVLPPVSPPHIIEQPASQSVYVRSQARIRVTATGMPAPNYQWYRNGFTINDSTNRSGTRTPELVIGRAQTADAGKYWVVVSNALGIVTSQVAQVTILPAPVLPVIKTQPKSQSVKAGTNLTLSVVATGTSPLRYQWHFNAGPISSGTNASLVLSKITVDQSGEYHVVVGNDAGEVSSQKALVTVVEPPQIVAQPLGGEIWPGESFAFTVEAAGTSPLSYQWRKNNSSILRATNAAYRIESAKTNDGGAFSVVVKNGAGSVTSIVAELNIRSTIWKFKGRNLMTDSEMSRDIAFGTNFTMFPSSATEYYVNALAPDLNQLALNGDELSSDYHGFHNDGGYSEYFVRCLFLEPNLVLCVVPRITYGASDKATLGVSELYAGVATNRHVPQGPTAPWEGEYECVFYDIETDRTGGMVTTAVNRKTEAIRLTKFSATTYRTSRYTGGSEYELTEENGHLLLATSEQQENSWKECRVHVQRAPGGRIVVICGSASYNPAVRSDLQHILWMVGAGQLRTNSESIVPPANPDPAHLVWIEPGTFVMGSPNSESDRDWDEEPQTTVALTKGFWMGRYEVTQEEYQGVIGNNPSSFTGAKLPVETVSWDDATNYCGKMTAREKAAGRLPDGHEYRLPAEAQWEYGCRAGRTTPFGIGDGTSLGSTQANCDGENPYGGAAAGPSLGMTATVGSYAPNDWGLYDMHGNVWEWCWDWYGAYPGGSQTNWVQPNTGSLRVVRGGSWGNCARYCRSALRLNGDPGFCSSGLGFRVVLVQVSTDRP